MTRGAGLFMQVLSVPVIAYGFVATILMLINSGFEGLSIILWPGLAYIGMTFIGFWMLKSGQRAAREKA